MRTLYHQRMKLSYLSVLGIFFVVLFLFPHPSHAAKACGETGCAEYGCNSGLLCNSGNDTCGIKYNNCTGATCVQDNSWDTSSPCTTADVCTPAGTTRTAAWSGYGACSVACGNGTQTRTCTCGTQNNCTVQCATPVGACNATDSQACCVSQAPQKPVITSAGSGSCTTDGVVSVVWTFGTGGCGGAWGFACSSASNSFSIMDGATTIVSDILPTGSSPYTRSVTLSSGNHSLKVCASNGLLSTCSDVFPTTINIDTTAPPVPVPTVEFVQDFTCQGKSKIKYSWNAVSDVGCAGVDPSTPYWSQASLSNTFSTNDFPLNGWGNYLSQTTNTAYPGGTVVYTHVQSRDALNNQSNWNSPATTIIVPSPILYPAIHVNGPLVGGYQEKIIDGASTVCTAMKINSENLTLQANVPPYVTPICTKDSNSYSCTFTIDNQTPANACVSNSITVGMSGIYSGYSSVGWLSGNSCTGTPTTLPLNAGDIKNDVPLFFTYDATGQMGWFKVSNASFTNRLTAARNNFVPFSVQPYDETDDASTHNFSIKSAGVVSQQSLLNVGANAQDASGNPLYAPSPNVYTNGYTQMNDVDFEKYTQYVEARKGLTSVASLAEITGNGVYLVPSSVTVDATATALLSNKNVVIITKGANAITINSDFTPANASVAFVSPTITIDPAVKKINAVLIAGTVQTGNSVNELKISGNLVAQNVIVLQRKRSNPRQPSFYVDVNMKSYIDLLPYLSVSTYDWKQTQ